MTIEEKAKAYDSIIEKANKMHSEDCEACQACIEELIPELKESEDERIRKEIQNAIEQLDKDSTICGKKYDYNQWLTWLEKQGEQRPVEIMPIFRIGDVIRKKGKDYTFNVDRIQGGYYHCDQKNGAFFPIEEQDSWELVEQKPADKVEPKFKVGDWIVNEYYGTIHQIKNVCTNVSNGKDAYDLTDGEYISTSNEINYHLWTIQDAKDGDVLIASDGSIFLFKDTHDSACIHYVALTTDDVVKFNEELKHYWETSKAVHPATKEQRNALMKAITDAGYEWDAEKKELKKIDARENLTLDGDLMEADCMIVEQKPAWSEKDEEMLNDAIGAVGAADYYTYDDKQEIEKWLKSLKQRIGE